MWEDFVRGNWPAAASVTPAPVQLPSTTPVTTGPPWTDAVSPAHVAGYARPTSSAAAVGYAHAQVTRRPVGGRVAVKTVLAAGAGLVLALVVPSYALASGSHVIGAHTTSSHVAAHAATGR
jgi:hypothetical protein